MNGRIKPGVEQEKSARRQPGAGNGQKRAASLHASKDTTERLPRQAFPSLIAQAKHRADQAAVMWQCCRAAGDVRGAATWRRRQFKHQAILFALTRNRQGIDNENGASGHNPQVVTP